MTNFHCFQRILKLFLFDHVITQIILSLLNSINGNSKFAKTISRYFFYSNINFVFCSILTVFKIWLQHLRQHHPGYQNIEINNAAWDVLPENGNISTEIPALESEEVSAIPLAPEEENQYIDDPVTDGIPDLQQNELEIDQLRAEIRNQRNSRRRSQGLMELQAPTCQLTPLNEFDESLPLFSNAFPYLFPDGKAEFRIP